jgi:menaquinone-dependent protoporphyrinogen oxidase
MEKKILVTYASKHGATAEIAERIDAILQEKGFPTKLVSLEEPVDPGPFDVVIIGSAIYIGQWRKKVVKFLKAYEQPLSEKKCWIFSTGPTGTGDPDELLKGWEYPDGLKDTITTISPAGMTIFHGVIDEDKLNALEKMTIKLVKAPTGDFRDWGAVQEWAEEIAGTIQKG